MLYNELPTKISVISGHNNNNNSRELEIGHTCNDNYKEWTINISDDANAVSCALSFKNYFVFHLNIFWCLANLLVILLEYIICLDILVHKVKLDISSKNNIDW